MKIKANHYTLLRDRLFPYLKDHPELTRDSLLNSMRLRWDSYWNCGTPITNASEFNYLNDDHIDTAIKALIREYYN